ncbi:MAG: helix-turn-helix transcriptional regulator [Planctomycetota bacterium]|nr:helix-turn-helix transcriptional regulator [Planctomycetota bacterium]
MEERCPCAGGTLGKLLQPAVLAVLSEESTHGYRLLHLLAGMPMFREQRPDATGLYRCLKEMERRGLITSAVVASQKGPAARVYHATPLGYSCLLRWMGTLNEHRRALGSLLSKARRAVKRSQAAGRFGAILPQCGAGAATGKERRPSTEREPAVADASKDDPLIFLMGLYKAVLPKRLLYSEYHSWFEVAADGKTRCGLTSYAVRLLGDLFRIEWRVNAGAAVTSGQVLGELESAKAVSEVYAPLSGPLLSVNAAVVQDPSLLNADPYSAWLLEFGGQPASALQPGQYLEFLKSGWEKTQKLLKGQA